jgi:hypothetical protein
MLFGAVAKAAGAAGAALTLLGAQPATAQGTTPAQAAESFVTALSAYCLPAILEGRAVADVAPDAADPLRLASDRDRESHPAAREGGGFWETSRAPGIVFVSEPGIGICRVTAHGLPPQETVDAAAAAVLAASGGFKASGGLPPDPNAIERFFVGGRGERCTLVFISARQTGRYPMLLASVRLAPPESRARKECVDG